MSALGQIFHGLTDRFWAGVPFMGLCLVLLLYKLHKFDSSNIAVVTMALVAAIMTVRTAKWGLESLGWLALTAILAVFAIRATNEEDKRRNRQFAAVLDRLTETIRIGDQRFEQNLAKENSILDVTKTAADLSKQNLDTVSGEGSYPCIVPQSHAVVNGVVPLVVSNRGKNNLTGVEVRIVSDTEFLDGRSLFYKPPAELGTLRSEWPKPLPEGVIPKPGDDGVAHYTAEIWTQNGYYIEVINFRRGKYTLPWAYQYWLNQEFGFPRRQHVKTAEQIRTEVKQGRKALDACSQGVWSDDAGDGRPVPKPLK